MRVLKFPRDDGYYWQVSAGHSWYVVHIVHGEYVISNGTTERHLSAVGPKGKRIVRAVEHYEEENGQQP